MGNDKNTKRDLAKGIARAGDKKLMEVLALLIHDMNNRFGMILTVGEGLEEMLADGELDVKKVRLYAERICKTVERFKQDVSLFRAGYMDLNIKSLPPREFKYIYESSISIIKASLQKFGIEFDYTPIAEDGIVPKGDIIIQVLVGIVDSLRLVASEQGKLSFSIDNKVVGRSFATNIICRYPFNLAVVLDESWDAMECFDRSGSAWALELGRIGEKVRDLGGKIVYMGKSNETNVLVEFPKEDL